MTMVQNVGIRLLDLRFEHIQDRRSGGCAGNIWGSGCEVQGLGASGYARNKSETLFSKVGDLARYPTCVCERAKQSRRLCQGVASISRLLKMIGLFCKRDPEKRRYSAKETYNFKEPTNRRHPTPNFPCQITIKQTFRVSVRFSKVSSDRIF